MNALAKAIGVILLSLVALSMFGTHLFSRPNNPDTYYDVLGLNTVQASNKDIKVQYRGMVRKLHPDHRRHLSAEEQAATERYTLEQINQAYKVLSNPKQRIRYDFSLANAGNYHYEIYTQSLTDKVKRLYEYNASWDNPGYRNAFSSIDDILLGYEINFPQWSKLAREIYQKNVEDDQLDTVDIKPYILERVKSYDNVVSYHFSDWQDQLDKPRQNLINTASIIFSIVAAMVPIWHVCGGAKTDDIDLQGVELDENGNPIEVTPQTEFERAGWTPEQIKAHKELQRQRRNEAKIQALSKTEDKDMIRELNKLNKQKQEEVRIEKMAEMIKKKQKANQTTQNTTALAAGNHSGAEGGFNCQPCGKRYQSEPQYQQHLNSTKHLKTIKDLEKKK